MLKLLLVKSTWYLWSPLHFPWKITPLYFSKMTLLLTTLPNLLRYSITNLSGVLKSRPETVTVTSFLPAGQINPVLVLSVTLMLSFLQNMSWSSALTIHRWMLRFFWKNSSSSFSMLIPRVLNKRAIDSEPTGWFTMNDTKTFSNNFYSKALYELKRVLYFHWYQDILIHSFHKLQQVSHKF